MAISTLQQGAFQLSPEFNKQVNAIVKREAETKAEALPPGEMSTARQTYGQVIRQPDAYGFVSAITADNGWTLTYDAWAADPESQDAQYAILTTVQRHWLTLVGA